MSEARELLFGTGSIRWMQQLFGPDHPVPFLILSLLGDTWGILFVVGLSAWVFGRHALYPVVAIVIAGAASKLLLSDLFGVSRPAGSDIVVHESLEIGSFPSGHVYQVVGPWGMLYMLGCVPFWLPVAIAILVALGRIYMGAHFLADVLAAMGFGALLVWAFSRAWPPVREWLHHRGWGFYAGLAALAVAGTLFRMHAVGLHPRRYEVFGMIIATAIALPLGHRYMLYEPAPAARAARAGRVVVGLLGILACLLWDRSQPDHALLLGTFTAGLATLWALAGAPALFRYVPPRARRSGSAGRPRPSDSS